MVRTALRRSFFGLALLGASCAAKPARADLDLFMILTPYEKGDADQKHQAVIALYGLIYGVFGANVVSAEQNKRKVFCLDDPEVMGAQAYFTILSDYVKMHPGSDSLSAGLILSRALAERYPCPS